MPQFRMGEVISQGISRVGVVCFRPFKWRKWALFTLAAWLAGVNEWNAMGAVPNFAVQGIAPVVENFTAIVEILRRHMVVSVTVALTVVLVFFGMYLLLRWVNSRGHFMLFDAIVENNIQPRESWARHRKLGNNLMKFRIYWDLTVFNLFLVILIIGAALLWPDIKPVLLEERGFAATWWTWASLIFTGLSVIGLALLLTVATLILEGMVIPVMYIRKMRAWPAVKHVIKEMVLREKKASLLYLLTLLLTQFVRASALGIGGIVVVVVTLCIGYLLLLVPILSLIPAYGATLVALPVEVYERAFSLYFLRQFGPEYEVPWQTTLPGGFPVIVNESLPAPQQPV